MVDGGACEVELPGLPGKVNTAILAPLSVGPNVFATAWTGNGIRRIIVRQMGVMFAGAVVDLVVVVHARGSRQ